MTNNTETIGTDPNIYSCLNDKLGQYFEDQIFNLITLALKKYFTIPEKKVVLNQTPRKGDNGKDIIITSTVDINNLFFHDFQLNDKDKINIFIECKSTDNKILRFNSIIPNVTRSKYDRVDYFVLVTNSTIIPDNYVRLNRELESKNIKFIRNMRQY